MVIDQLGKEELGDFTLAKTDTFMNQSGKFIKSWIRLNYPMIELRRMYKNLMIIHDDIDIPIGQFKIQKGRGAAGHKGVQSIIDELDANDFWRIRVGICPKVGKPENVEKFVLQKFNKEELGILEKVISETASTIIGFTKSSHDEY